MALSKETTAEIAVYRARLDQMLTKHELIFANVLGAYRDAYHDAEEASHRTRVAVARALCEQAGIDPAAEPGTGRAQVNMILLYCDQMLSRASRTYVPLVQPKIDHESLESD